MTLPKKGKFIAFEGADDLGKTTQMELIYKSLLDKGENIIKTREPGGTEAGAKLRDILLNSVKQVPPLSELTLFMVDKNIHYEQVIKPYLAEGYTILCDRFQLSTLVYQHKLKGLDINYVNYLHNILVDGIWPDITFVFHGERQTNVMKDNYEISLGNKSHEKLNKYYYEYGEILPNHILINANRPKEVIYEELLSFMG